MGSLQTQIPPNIAPFVAIYGPGDLFIYNDIPLLILQANMINRQAIYAGPDYLYTRHTLQLSCVFNPAVMAYLPSAQGVLVGGRPPDPQATFGVGPAVTDAALRTWLLEPRRALYWVMGATNYPQSSLPVLLFQSPNVDGAQVDANNGPTPLFCNVNRRVGSKTFLVNVMYQTDVNEINSYNTSLPPAILSNRWSMSQSLNEQFFAVRTIHGQVVFRTDVLQALGALPDDFREWFFFPVPGGFKRTGINVSQNADGTAISYTIIDTEQEISVLSAAQTLFGVVKIEGVHSVEEWNEGYEAFLMKHPGVVAGLWEIKKLTEPSARSEAVLRAHRRGEVPVDGKMGGVQLD